jgi:methylenetetrahydrofolate dehydrogenase (NADP+)/methenyltetrahydrofolate cyclohydrolase
MIINGTQIAENLEKDLKKRLAMKPQKKVAFVLFGNNTASMQFIKIKSRVADRLGIVTTLFHYPEIISTEQALLMMDQIIDQPFDGIVVQLPLPAGMDTQKILNRIPVEKDIDVLSDHAKQQYQSGEVIMIPPVAGAVWEILTSINTDLIEKQILIIGNGKLVGEPVTMMLSRNNILFMIVDKDTDLNHRNELLKNADIIISGVGIPHMITSEMIKQGVILIDAGTSELSGKLVGDIDPQCAEKASYLTPVPGGVGPITVVVLFANLLR